MMDGLEVGMRFETRRAMKERYLKERAKCDICSRKDEHFHDEIEVKQFYDSNYDWTI